MPHSCLVRNVMTGQVGRLFRQDERSAWVTVQVGKLYEDWFLVECEVVPS